MCHPAPFLGLDGVDSVSRRCHPGPRVHATPTSMDYFLRDSAPPSLPPAFRIELVAPQVTVTVGGIPSSFWAQRRVTDLTASRIRAHFWDVFYSRGICQGAKSLRSQNFPGPLPILMSPTFCRTSP